MLVVAGAVGGITDQIEDGRSGLLLDPHDLEQFGGANGELAAALRYFTQG